MNDGLLVCIACLCAVMVFILGMVHVQVSLTNDCDKLKMFRIADKVYVCEEKK